MTDVHTAVEWRTRYAQGPDEFDAALDGLADSDLDASYAHPEIGWEPVPFSVGEMVQGYSKHLHEHIAEIGKIRALHGI